MNTCDDCTDTDCPNQGSKEEAHEICFITETKATESPTPSGKTELVGYATQLDNHDCAAWASKLLNSCQCDDGWKSAEKVAAALLYAFKLGKEAK